MIRFFACLCIVTLTGFSLYAQQQSQIVSATQKDDLAELTSASFQYIFPDFTEGNVVYHTGKSIPGLLNYNILLGEMQFMDPQTQEVFALSDRNEINMVKIGHRIFVPFTGKEYLEILSVGAIQLAARSKGNRLSHGRATPYGNSSPAARSSDMVAVNEGGYMAGLEAKENIRVTTTTDYYLISNKRPLMITGSKSFLKVFPKEKSQVIQQFIQQNRIDFKDRSNLLLLINYCDQL